MAKKQVVKMVQCRYPKCFNLHETTELKKEDAIQSGKSYYHSDCYHTMQTITKIRDTFVKEIDPTLTGRQIGALVSIVNNMVFDKKVDVDYILFSVEYMIKNKPGALKHPGGIAYIIQNDEIKKAWRIELNRKIRAEMKEAQKTAMVNDEFRLDLPDDSFEYKPQKTRSFADILH